MRDEQRGNGRIRGKEADRKVPPDRNTYAGAGTDGDPDAAAGARGCILERLKTLQGKERSIEFKFTLADKSGSRPSTLSPVS